MLLSAGEKTMLWLIGPAGLLFIRMRRDARALTMAREFLRPFAPNAPRICSSYPFLFCAPFLPFIGLTGQN
jgi:hypothetical protein